MTNEMTWCNSFAPWRKSLRSHVPPLDCLFCSLRESWQKWCHRRCLAVQQKKEPLLSLLSGRTNRTLTTLLTMSRQRRICDLHYGQRIAGDTLREDRKRCIFTGRYLGRSELANAPSSKNKDSSSSMCGSGYECCMSPKDMPANAAAAAVVRAQQPGSLSLGQDWQILEQTLELNFLAKHFLALRHHGW
jgi:hypothetical protein